MALKLSSHHKTGRSARLGTFPVSYLTPRAYARGIKASSFIVFSQARYVLVMPQKEFELAKPIR